MGAIRPPETLLVFFLLVLTPLSVSLASSSSFVLFVDGLFKKHGAISGMSVCVQRFSFFPLSPFLY